MQAAKYFTFIFFGLSVFVILLFGGFVVCHCYRRLRYAQEHPSGPQVRAYFSIMDLVTAWQACPAKLAVSGSALLHQTLAHHIQHTEGGYRDIIHCNDDPCVLIHCLCNTR